MSAFFITSKHSEIYGLGLFFAGLICGIFSTALGGGIFTGAAFALSLCGGALYAAAPRKDALNIPISMLMAFMYFGYLLINVSLSQTPFYSLTSMATYTVLPLTLLYMLSSPHDPVKSARQFGIFFTAIASGLAIWALIQFFLLSDMFGLRASHPLPNANTLAALFVIAFLIMCSLFYEYAAHNQKYKILFIVTGMSIILGGLLATGSRGGLLSCVVGFILFHILLFPHMRPRLILWILCPITLFAVSQIMDASNSENFTGYYREAFHSRGTSERMTIWQDALAMIKDAPLYGYGLGSYSAIMPPYRSPANDTAGLNAHSDYLHLGVEAGLIGLILFGALIFYGGFVVLRYLFRSVTRPKASASPYLNEKSDHCILAGYIAALCAVLLHGLITSLMISISHSLMLGFMAYIVFKTLDQSSLAVAGIKTAKAWPALSLLSGIIFSLLIFTPPLSSHYIKMAQKALEKQDIERFDALLQTADRLSYHTNPAVFLKSAELPFAMIATSGDEMSVIQRQQLSTRLNELYDAAIARNPYMALPWFKKGELALHLGRIKKAEEHLTTALKIDGGFLPARLKLAKLKKLQGNTERYEDILLKGYHWHYWRFDPLEYYELLRPIVKRTDNAPITIEALNAKTEDTIKRQNRAQKSHEIFSF